MPSYYQYESGKCKLSFIKDRIKNAERLLENYPENAFASDVLLSDIDKISANLFTANLNLLASAEDIERKSGLFYDEDYRRICTENVPISIDFTNEKLIVKTPLTIKRSDSKSQKIAKENYIIQSFIAAKIAEFSEKYPDKKQEIRSYFSGKFLTFYVIRYAKNFSPSTYCDNDNMENKRVQNAICTLAGVSDRADKMDLHTCFRLCEKKEDIGMKFVLTGSTDTPILNI